MKKLTNQVEYQVKGTLTEFENDVIHCEIVGKNDVKIDEVNLEGFVTDVKNFCARNIDQDIEMKFSIKVVNEQ